MRLLAKLLKKLVLLVVMMTVTGIAVKHGWRFAMRAAGMPQVSSEESDLMSTVFDSATRLVSGSAKKDELAKELSDKLYAGRGNAQEMAELGIELGRPGASPSATTPSGSAPVAAATPPGNKIAGAPTAGGPPSLDDLKKKVPVTLLEKIRVKLGADGIVMALLPVAFVGMIAVRKLRRKPSKMDEFMPLVNAMQNSGDSETYDMQFAVGALGAEDYELLIALIYQRQGYRVSMPAGLSGGRGGDFILARKAERVLVQCKKLAGEHRIAVERVREFHEAMVAGGFTRGLYVASCGYSWDARHFAKTKGITLINGRTLDQLITAARENPDEDLLAVAQWAPKFLQKITLTPALCPTCDAAMDEIVANGQTVWLCAQRPDCRGRRNARKRQKPAPGIAPTPASSKPAGSASAKPAVAPAAKPASKSPASARPPASRRAKLPTIISKRMPKKPAEPEAAPSVPASPATAPDAEEIWPPASLKSVVPQKRPAPAKKPGPAPFDHRAHPLTAVPPAKISRKASANPPRPSKGSDRPGARR